MEPQDTKKASAGKRKFTVKTSEEEETIPVRLLFKPSSAAKALPVPEAPAESRAASYADYIVGRAGTASTSQVNQQATATTTSTEPARLHEDQKSAAAPLGATEETGCSSNPAPRPGARHSSIIVSPRQRGNPILKFVRNVPWEFGEIVPDYVLGQSTCALFLSLRYHNLNPNYIHERLRNLGRTYMLQVLLLQVDVKDPHQAIKELAKICILADCTLILAWSPEEAGRYLETYKAYEQKPADALKEKVDQDYLSRATDCLTSVKSVNRTDTLSLLSNFGAKRLFDILHEPFLKAAK